jgi:hypothetical protein
MTVIQRILVSWRPAVASCSATLPTPDLRRRFGTRRRRAAREIEFDSRWRYYEQELRGFARPAAFSLDAIFLARIVI